MSEVSALEKAIEAELEEKKAELAQAEEKYEERLVEIEEQRKQVKVGLTEARGEVTRREKALKVLRGEPLNEHRRAIRSGKSGKVLPKESQLKLTVKGIFSLVRLREREGKGVDNTFSASDIHHHIDGIGYESIQKCLAWLRDAAIVRRAGTRRRGPNTVHVFALNEDEAVGDEDKALEVALEALREEQELEGETQGEEE